MKRLTNEFRTCIQTTFHDASQFSEFERLLETLQQLGFYGIELNLPQLDSISPRKLKDVLAKYDLTLHMLATGAYAKAHGLSLSNPILQEREAAILGAKANIDYAAQMGCGVIFGFFKGPKEGAVNARELLISSLTTLACYAEEKGVDIFLEATNRKETTVATTLADTLSIIQQVGQSNVKLLADTYHIELEEPPVRTGILAHANGLVHLHISDNNRCFPGLGSLDFAEIYASLREIGFSGVLSIEGNVVVSEMDDVKKSVAYLSGL